MELKSDTFVEQILQIQAREFGKRKNRSPISFMEHFLLKQQTNLAEGQ
jgi:hypothetical protein